jgi:hypothetical protein
MLSVLCRISCSQSTVTEDSRLLGCDPLPLCEQFLVFADHSTFKMLETTHPMILCHNPKDLNHEIVFFMYMVQTWTF